MWIEHAFPLGAGIHGTDEDSLQTDFILLSCDTLFLPFSAATTTASSSSHQPPSLAGLLDLHRENSNLLTTLWYERSSALSSNIDEAKDDPSSPNAVGGGAAGGAAGGSGVGGKGKQAGGKGKGGKGGKDDKDKAGKKKESEEDQVDDDEYGEECRCRYRSSRFIGVSDLSRLLEILQHLRC